MDTSFIQNYVDGVNQILVYPSFLLSYLFI